MSNAVMPPLRLAGFSCEEAMEKKIEIGLLVFPVQSGTDKAPGGGFPHETVIVDVEAELSHH